MSRRGSWPRSTISTITACRFASFTTASDHLEAITLIDNLTGRQETSDTCWLFRCLGGLPNTNWAAESGLVRDEQCYFVTGPDLRQHSGFAKTWPLDREPYYLVTSFPGTFAMGLSNDAPRLSQKAQWLLPWFTAL
jgi:thioredoxin reductase (NADPH)